MNTFPTMHAPQTPNTAAAPLYAASSTNLFVRYLPREVDDALLRDIFAVYGSIVSSMVMRDIHSGQSLGTAFVRYAAHADAQRALCEAHGLSLFGKNIAVHWAKQQHDTTPAGQDRLKVNKLFLRNVPMDVTEREVAELVASHGTVKKVTLHNDTTPVAEAAARRRIVFVTFCEEGAAEMALRAVHNTCPFAGCRGVPLMCKLINDAIKSKKHRLRNGPTEGHASYGAPVAAAVPAVAPEAAASHVDGSKTRAARKLSVVSLLTLPPSPFASCGDESTATTPSRSFDAVSWELRPASTTFAGCAFAFSTPKPAGSGCPSQTSSPGSSAGTPATGRSRFCHNPYSMFCEKMYV